MKTRSHSVFFILTLSGILILLLFTYLTQRTIESGINPKENARDFFEFNRYLTIGNYVVFFVLLFVANIMYISRKYWDTFIWAGIIFVTFAMVDWWWLGEMIFHYKKENDLWMGEFSLGPFIGIIISIFGLVIAIGNYFLLKRIVKEKNSTAQGSESSENSAKK